MDAQGELPAMARIAFEKNPRAGWPDNSGGDAKGRDGPVSRIRTLFDVGLDVSEESTDKAAGAEKAASGRRSHPARNIPRHRRAFQFVRSEASVKYLLPR